MGCVSFIDASSACAKDETARLHELEIPRSVTGTGTLGVCPLAWASGDVVLVATHTDELRSFRRDRHLDVDLSQI